MHDVTRRGFIGSAVAAGAALSPCAAALGASPKGEKMRFGLVTYQWGKDWDLPTLIANCEAGRVQGVELRTTHAHGVEPSLTAAERAEVKKRFADSSVVCVGPGSNERFDNPDPAAVKKAIEATKAFVKLSRDIGGTGVKVKPDRFWPSVEREKTIEQIGKSLNECGRFAADYGQQIRLEVHGQCAELPTIAAIMAVADHPSVAVCWNGNQQDLQGEGLEHNFNLVKDRFGATAHTRQFDAPGYPWDELIALFVAMDYEGYVMIESSTQPKDKVAELKRQRGLFDALVKKARG